MRRAPLRTLAAFAFVLGVCNSIQVTPPRPSRRSFVGGALGVVAHPLPSAAARPSAAGAAAQPKLFGTRSGILYFDLAGGGGSGAPPARGDGDRVTIAFTVRRGGFDSDDVLETGSGSFAIGDNSANDAVDELVRTMRGGVVRRATVPASFRFDPDRPSAPTYLELEVLPAAARRRRGAGGDCAAVNQSSSVLRPWLAAREAPP